MNLRTKTLLAVGSVVVVLTIVMTAVSRWAVTRSVYGEEQSDAAHSAEQVRIACEEEVRNLTTRIGDWAVWDDAYQFTLKPNEQFRRLSLAPASVEAMGLDLFAFLNGRDSAVFTWALDPAGERTDVIPPAVRDLIDSGVLSLKGVAGDTWASGLVSVDEHALLVTARPVLRSDGTGPAAGTILATRWLDSVETGHWSRLVGVGVSLHRLEPEPDLGPAERAALARPGTRADTVVFRSHDTLVSYAEIVDLSGHGAFLLRAAAPRELHAQVRRSAGSFVVTFIGLCLLFGAAILALLELFVLSRLGRLGQDVRDVGAGPGRGQRIRVQGRDEIGRLAQDVNVTLEALHQQQERFRDVAFCSADWVWEVDAQGRYTYCSDHVREVLGYEPEEVLGRTPFDLMPEDERARIGPEFAALAAERRPVVDMENRNLCKDGREVLLLTNGVPILDDAGNLLGYRGVDKDITEKKRAEAALRESEERYRGLFNQNLTAVFRSTLDGRLLACNEAFVRMLGFESQEQALGTPTADLYFEKGDRATFLVRLERERTLTDLESRLRRRDGSELSVLESVLLTADPATKQPVIQGTMIDITARRRAEAALRESEERYRDLFENSTDLIQSIGPDGRYLFTNRAWREALGYSEEEVAGMSFMDVVAPESRGRCAATFEQVMSSMGVPAAEAVFLARDGHQVIVEGNVGCQKKDGRPVATRGFFRDVTEQRRAEEALRSVQERREQLEHIVNRSPAVAFLWRVAPGWPVDFVSVNVRQFGYEAADFLSGRVKYADLVHPDDLARAEAEAMANIKAGGSEYVQQYRLVTRSGEVRWVEDRTWVPHTRDGAVNHHQGIVIDITERKRSEEELAQKNAELRQLNDQKNQFLGMAAHDLRNPLAVIQTASGFLLEDVAKKLPVEKKLDFIRRMKTNSEFMLRLIDDLLDVAKIESGKLELDLREGDIGGLVEDNLALNVVLAEKKRIRLSFRPGELPRVRFDRGKVEQVLNNLVSNAIKFSPADTSVEVTTARIDGAVVVAVRDQGQGIPPDELGRLFQPFSRTSVRATAGEKSTGLGLAIARKIVEGHGGRIWAESRVGIGSVFSFSLPVQDGHQPASNSQQPAAGQT